MPKVSVVLTLYNRADLVEQSARSVLDQTFGDFELLVIDDASSDDGLEIVRRLGDPRIVCHRLERNVGCGGARNAGIDLAQGEWIALQDSDDLWAPHKLERQMALLREEPEAAFVATWGRDFWVEDGVEEPLGAWQALPDPALLKAYLVFNNPIPAPSILLWRHALNERGLRFRGRAEDYDMWSRLAETADLHVVPEELVRIRQHGGRLTEMEPNGTLNDADEVRRRLLEGLRVPFDEEELRLHCYLAKGGTSELGAVERWLHKLSVASRRLPEREAQALRTVVGMWWLRACQATSGSRGQKFARWLRADLARTSLSPRHYGHALTALHPR